jgi:uncharacterized small protein (DUF1192 family)
MDFAEGVAWEETLVDDPAEPRRGRGQALSEALKEDLEVFGVEELAERIELLEAEVIRVRSQMERKKASRSAADALFGPRS